MKKHVNEEHKNEKRHDELKESPLRKEAKKEDPNLRSATDQEQDDTAMEETKEEEKEVKEAKREEEALEMRKRLYDQNIRLYDLEQQQDKMLNENKTVKAEAISKIRKLEENIQEEAKAVKRKVKKLEQIKTIERQNKEI